MPHIHSTGREQCACGSDDFAKQAPQTQNCPVRNDNRVSTATAPAAATLSVIASFNGTNGQGPRAGMFIDTSGNLFGMTELGGKNNDGTIFKIAAGSGTITSLASFAGTSNGSLPLGDLFVDSSGNFFGTAEGGGANGNGTIFKLPAGSGTISPVASFSSTTGANPYAGLTNISGTLYGTTELGGASSIGNIFKLPSGSSTITNVASFNDTNGNQPAADMIADRAGNLYGTTGYGGANGDGTIFKLSAGSSTITTLASFNGSNGTNPYGSLIEDSAGNFYGADRQRRHERLWRDLQTSRRL